MNGMPQAPGGDRSWAPVRFRRSRLQRGLVVGAYLLVGTAHPSIEFQRIWQGRENHKGGFFPKITEIRRRQRRVTIALFDKSDYPGMSQPLIKLARIGRRTTGGGRNTSDQAQQGSRF